MQRAQHTSFNTLDNQGHKTPTQSKKRKDKKERLKSHSPKHIQYTRLQIYTSKLYYYDLLQNIGSGTVVVNFVQHIFSL